MGTKSTHAVSAPIDRLVRPLRLFAEKKIAGAILLAAAAAVAVVWANSPWREHYAEILETHLTVGIGAAAVDKSIHHWINDGLMGIFFFVVGLEIKREVLVGELSSLRQASLPVVAALGGMAAPAAIYIAVNWGGDAIHGWGIPMATDIAFALGVLLLLGSRVPLGLKVFLTALAIVDDIGAIIVIAVFYTDAIALGSLITGGVLVIVSIAANRAGVRNSVFYFIVGTVVWLAFLKSGIHATLAAVLMAMTIPARTSIDGAALVASLERQIVELKRSGLPAGHRLLGTEQQEALQDMEQLLEEANAPLQKLEHNLMPISTFLVMPIFALANAGVTVGHGFADAFTSPIALGVILGLGLGKPLGVLLFSWLAVKIGIADLPARVGWGQILAVGVLAGIGFTMSLFVAGLAFPDPAAIEIAKVGILSASIITGGIGYFALARTVRVSRP